MRESKWIVEINFVKNNEAYEQLVRVNDRGDGKQTKKNNVKEKTNELNTFNGRNFREFFDLFLKIRDEKSSQNFSCCQIR